jgi:N-acetylglucosaminyldiphosphoundecaprenol N-acetyl-beta-D-mannosaminyltransferase
MKGRSSTATCEVFGIDFFSGDLDTAARAVVERARAGAGGYACLCNVHVLMTAQRDVALREALKEAWSVFPDGAPVAWLQRQVGARTSQRVAGADLMTRVFALGEEAGLRHYLFGSTPDVISELQRRFADGFPAALVGSESPPFGPVESLEPSAELAAAQPDVVWCSLGAPKQELWMGRCAEQLKPAVVLGVGAAFDFLAGRKSRAPLWLQESGLEWLHRLLSEPRRLAGRYLRTNSEFALRTAISLLKAGMRR